MVHVAIRALQEDEETILEDTLLEFNEMAEIEPKFFRKHFKEIL